MLGFVVVRLEAWTKQKGASLFEHRVQRIEYDVNIVFLYTRHNLIGILLPAFIFVIGFYFYYRTLVYCIISLRISFCSTLCCSYWQYS